MSTRYSIAQARSNLPRLVREADSGRPVELTRHGERVAVLIGRRQYDQLRSSLRAFSDAYDDFTRAFDLGQLDIDPDRVFSGVREGVPGREVDL